MAPPRGAPNLNTKITPAKYVDPWKVAKDFQELLEGEHQALLNGFRHFMNLVLKIPPLPSGQLIALTRSVEQALEDHTWKTAHSCTGVHLSDSCQDLVKEAIQHLHRFDVENGIIATEKHLQVNRWNSRPSSAADLGGTLSENTLPQQMAIRLMYAMLYASAALSGAGGAGSWHQDARRRLLAHQWPQRLLPHVLNAAATQSCGTSEDAAACFVDIANFVDTVVLDPGTAAAPAVRARSIAALVQTVLSLLVRVSEFAPMPPSSSIPASVDPAAGPNIEIFRDDAALQQMGLALWRLLARALPGDADALAQVAETLNRAITTHPQIVGPILRALAATDLLKRCDDVWLGTAVVTMALAQREHSHHTLERAYRLPGSVRGVFRHPPSLREGGPGLHGGGCEVEAWGCLARWLASSAPSERDVRMHATRAAASLLESLNVPNSTRVVMLQAAEWLHAEPSCMGRDAAMLNAVGKDLLCHFAASARDPSCGPAVWEVAVQGALEPANSPRRLRTCFTLLQHLVLGPIPRGHPSRPADPRRPCPSSDSSLLLRVLAAAPALPTDHTRKLLALIVSASARDTSNVTPHKALVSYVGRTSREANPPCVSASSPDTTPTCSPGMRELLDTYLHDPADVRATCTSLPHAEVPPRSPARSSEMRLHLLKAGEALISAGQMQAEAVPGTGARRAETLGERLRLLGVHVACCVVASRPLPPQDTLQQVKLAVSAAAQLPPCAQATAFASISGMLSAWCSAAPSTDKSPGVRCAWSASHVPLTPPPTSPITTPPCSSSRVPEQFASAHSDSLCYSFLDPATVDWLWSALRRQLASLSAQRSSIPYHGRSAGSGPATSSDWVALPGILQCLLLLEMGCKGWGMRVGVSENSVSDAEIQGQDETLPEEVTWIRELVTRPGAVARFLCSDADDATDTTDAVVGTGDKNSTQVQGQTSSAAGGAAPDTCATPGANFSSDNHSAVEVALPIRGGEGAASREEPSLDTPAGTTSQEVGAKAGAKHPTRVQRMPWSCAPRSEPHPTKPALPAATTGALEGGASGGCRSFRLCRLPSDMLLGRRAAVVQDVLDVALDAALRYSTLAAAAGLVPRAREPPCTSPPGAGTPAAESHKAVRSSQCQGTTTSRSSSRASYGCDRSDGDGERSTDGGGRRMEEEVSCRVRTFVARAVAIRATLAPFAEAEEPAPAPPARWLSADGAAGLAALLTHDTTCNRRASSEDGGGSGSTGAQGSGLLETCLTPREEEHVMKLVTAVLQESLEGPWNCEDSSMFLHNLRAVAKLAFEKCHQRCPRWASVLGLEVQPLAANAGRRTRRGSGGAALLPRNVHEAADDAGDPLYDARGGLSAVLSARSPPAIAHAQTLPPPLSPCSSPPCKIPGTRSTNTSTPAAAPKAGKSNRPEPPVRGCVRMDGLAAPLSLLEAALGCYDAAQQSRGWRKRRTPRDPVLNCGSLEAERAEREAVVLGEEADEEHLKGCTGGAQLLARLAGPEMLRASGRAGYAAVCPHYSSCLWTSAGEAAASRPITGVALMLATHLHHEAHREGGPALDVSLELLRLLQLVMSSHAASACSTRDVIVPHKGSTSQSGGKWHDLEGYTVTLLTRCFHKFIQPCSPSPRLGGLVYALLQLAGREPGERARLARDVLHATTEEAAVAREGRTITSGRWAQQPGAGVHQGGCAAVNQDEAVVGSAMGKEASEGSTSAEHALVLAALGTLSELPVASLPDNDVVDTAHHLARALQCTARAHATPRTSLDPTAKVWALQEVTVRLLHAIISMLEWCSERVELALEALAVVHQPRPITAPELSLPAAPPRIPDARKKKRRIVAEAIDAAGVPCLSNNRSSNININNDTPSPAPAPASSSTRTSVPLPMATCSEDRLHVETSTSVFQDDVSMTRSVEVGLVVVAALAQLLCGMQRGTRTKGDLEVVNAAKRCFRRFASRCELLREAQCLASTNDCAATNVLEQIQTVALLWKWSVLSRDAEHAQSSVDAQDEPSAGEETGILRYSINPSGKEPVVADVLVQAPADEPDKNARKGATTKDLNPTKKRKKGKRKQTSKNPYVQAAMECEPDTWVSSEIDDGYESLDDFIVCKPGRNYKKHLARYEVKSYSEA